MRDPGPPGELLATADAPRTCAVGAHRTAASSALEHDVGVEQREQRVEVAAARGREEGVDDLALPAQIGVRRRRSRPARGAGRGWRAAGPRPASAPTMRRDLVERHGEHVVQHERQPLGGRQRVEHHQQREADRVGQHRFVLGVGVGRRLGDRIGHAARPAAPRAATCASAACPGTPGRRPSSASRPGCSTPPVSARLSRSQASCTASSASLRRAEHPVGHRPQMGAVRLEPLRQPVLFVHPRIPPPGAPSQH